MIKTDYKSIYKDLYSGKVGEPVVVQVPALPFLTIDGQGDPNTSQDYMDAIQALYPVAYTIKFMCKHDLEKDFAVMPLESLWWTENMQEFSMANKDKWSWKAMIVLPDFVTQELYERAVEQVRSKKHPEAIGKVQLETYEEGRAAQVMYVGPYADEGPTIEKLHEFIKSQGGILDETNKHHHEIYLGDPRRTDPSKLKTIIRQPF